MSREYKEPQFKVMSYNGLVSEYITTSDLDTKNPEDNKNGLETDDKVDYFG